MTDVGKLKDGSRQMKEYTHRRLTTIPKQLALRYHNPHGMYTAGGEGTWLPERPGRGLPARLTSVEEPALRSQQ